MAKNSIKTKLILTKRSAEKSFNDFQKKVGRGVKTKLDTRAMRSAKKPLGEISGLASELDKSLAASNARVLAFGASVAVIGAVAKSFQSVAVASRDVEFSLARIQAITKSSSADIKKLGANIFEVALKTGQSFQVAADAALEFSRQGLSAAETSKRLKAALILVRTEGMDTAAAVSGLTASINGFNESGLGAIEILNKLDAVSNSFAVSTTDIVESMKRSAAVAQEAGVSLDQLAAITATVQQATARGGAVIGNAYKTIFTRMSNKSTINALEGIGVKVRSMSGDLLNAVDILKDVNRATKGLSSVAKSNIFEKIAGKRQIALLIPLLNDLAVENGNYTAALEKSKSATDEAIRKNELYSTTLKGVLAETSTLGTLLAAGIGDKVNSDLKNITSGFNNMIRSVISSLNSPVISAALTAFSTFLSGPGLVAGIVVAARLMGQFLVFAKDSAANLLGIKKTTAQVVNSEKSSLDVAKLKTSELAKQNAALKAQKGLLTTSTVGGVRGAAGGRKLRSVRSGVAASNASFLGKHANKQIGRSDKSTRFNENQLRKQLNLTHKQFPAFRKSMNDLAKGGKVSAASLKQFESQVKSGKGSLAAFKAVVTRATAAGASLNLQRTRTLAAQEAVNASSNRLAAANTAAAAKVAKSEKSRSRAAGVGSAALLVGMLAASTVGGGLSNAHVTKGKDGEALSRNDRSYQNRLESKAYSSVIGGVAGGAFIGGSMGGLPGAAAGAVAGGGIGVIQAFLSANLSSQEIMKGALDKTNAVSAELSGVIKGLTATSVLNEEEDGFVETQESIRAIIESFKDVVSVELVNKLDDASKNLDSFTEALKLAKSELLGKELAGKLNEDVFRTFSSDSNLKHTIVNGQSSSSSGRTSAITHAIANWFSGNDTKDSSGKSVQGKKDEVSAKLLEKRTKESTERLADFRSVEGIDPSLYAIDQTKRIANAIFDAGQETKKGESPSKAQIELSFAKHEVDSKAFAEFEQAIKDNTANQLAKQFSNIAEMAGPQFERNIGKSARSRTEAFNTQAKKRIAENARNGSTFSEGEAKEINGMMKKIFDITRQIEGKRISRTDGRGNDRPDAPHEPALYEAFTSADFANLPALFKALSVEMKSYQASLDAASLGIKTSEFTKMITFLQGRSLSALDRSDDNLRKVNSDSDFDLMDKRLSSLGKAIADSKDFLSPKDFSKASAAVQESSLANKFAKDEADILFDFKNSLPSILTELQGNLSATKSKEIFGGEGGVNDAAKTLDGLSNTSEMLALIESLTRAVTKLDDGGAGALDTESKIIKKLSAFRDKQVAGVNQYSNNKEANKLNNDRAALIARENMILDERLINTNRESKLQLIKEQGQLDRYAIDQNFKLNDAREFSGLTLGEQSTKRAGIKRDLVEKQFALDKKRIEDEAKMFKDELLARAELINVTGLLNLSTKALIGTILGKDKQNQTTASDALSRKESKSSIIERAERLFFGRGKMPLGKSRNGFNTPDGKPLPSGAANTQKELDGKKEGSALGNLGIDGLYAKFKDESKKLALAGSNRLAAIKKDAEKQEQIAALNEGRVTNLHKITKEEQALNDLLQGYHSDYVAARRALAVATVDPMATPADRAAKELAFKKLDAKNSDGSTGNPYGSFSDGMGQTLAQMQTSALQFKETLGREVPQLFASNMSQAFSSVLTGAASFEDAMLSAILNISDTLNQKFTENMFNNIFGSFGISGSSPSAKGYADGGMVTGGSGVRDDVPAVMMGGEYVIKKSAVDKHGSAFFDKLNSGSVPQFADGGFTGSAIGAGVTGVISTLIRNRQTKKANKQSEEEYREAMLNSGPRQSGSDFFIPGSIGPNGKRAGYISGKDDLTSFLNQKYTSGKTDRTSSSKNGFSFALEDQSRKLSVGAQIGAFGGNIAGEVQSAKGSAFDLLKQEAAIAQQLKDAKKARKKQLISSLIGAAVGAAGYAIGSAYDRRKNNQRFGGKDNVPEYNGDIRSASDRPSSTSSLSAKFAPTTRTQHARASSHSQYFKYPQGREDGSNSPLPPIGSYAAGGSNKGGGGTALTMAGEYIMNSDSVSKYSPEFFDRINSGSTPKFASGGSVGSSVGGSSTDSLGGDKMDELINEIKELNKKGGDESTGASTEINVTINSNGNGGGSSATASREEDKKLGEKIGNKVYEIFQLEKRQGGMLR
tara:strand:- start:2345 stop:8857 length:6513 start_codon:yes stop_codon:yes gene_type:complete